MRRVSPLSIVAICAAFVSPALAQTLRVSIPAKDFGPVWTGFGVGAAFGAGGGVGSSTNTAHAEE
jgi:hypothetical protein